MSHSLKLFPVGTVIPYMGSTAPDSSWVICDGSPLDINKYSKLHDILDSSGCAHVHGTNTFTIPDLRGRFIRGLSGSSGVDPGRVLGTNQNSSNLSHGHGAPSAWSDSRLGEYWMPANAIGGHYVLYSPMPGYTATDCLTIVPLSHTHGIGVSGIPADGGTESRPTNIALNYIIKAI